MLMKKCAMCSKFIPYGKKYCDDCKLKAEEIERERKAQSSKVYNAKRDKKYIKFYRSKEWKMLSRTRLQNDKYKCRVCGGLATEVDHIEPIQTEKGWIKRLDYSNTQSLCTRCHNIKHGRFLPKDNGRGGQKSMEKS